MIITAKCKFTLKRQIFFKTSLSFIYCTNLPFSRKCPLLLLLDGVTTLNYTNYDQITVRTTLVLLKNKKFLKWPNFRKQYIYVAKMTL